MRRLKMSWNTEGGHLVCRWIELKENGAPFSVADMRGSTMAQFAGVPFGASGPYRSR